MSIYLYKEKNTVIHRLDPRTKIIFLIASFILLLMPDNIWSVLFIFIIIFLYGLIAGVIKNIFNLKFILGGIFIFSVISWGFFYKEGSTKILLGMTKEGIQYGLFNAFKLVGTVSSGIFFLSVAKIEEISIGLVKLGIPYSVSFVLSTALRLVPTFIGTGAIVVEAQKSRGLDLESGNIYERLKKHVPLLTPIFLLAIRNTDQLAMALESRGFANKKNRSSYLKIKFKTMDYIIFLIIVLLAIIIFTL